MSEEIVGFETKLAESMMSPAEMRIPEKTYNKKSLKETINLLGSFDLRFYFSNVGCQIPDTIIVSNPSYLKKVAEMNKFIITKNDKAFSLKKMQALK